MANARVAAAALLVLLAAASAAGELRRAVEEPDAHAEHESGEEAAEHTVEPTYNYSLGGADWGGLCATGKAQSPINILSAGGHLHALQHDDLAFHYEDALHVEFVHNAHALRLHGSDLGHLVSGDKKYVAKSVTFRSPSEHSVDGHFFDLEAQVLHQFENASTLKGDLLVVSFLFRVGPRPAHMLEQLGWGRPHGVPAPGHARELEDVFNIGAGSEDALHNALAYAYTGSLTSPACDEGVQWRVLAHPISMTEHQKRTICRRFAANPAFNGGNGHGNNRESQPLNGREVLQLQLL